MSLYITMVMQVEVASSYFGLQVRIDVSHSIQIQTAIQSIQERLDHSPSSMILIPAGFVSYVMVHLWLDVAYEVVR